MPRTHTLTDLQSKLLSDAAARPDGNLLPSSAGPSFSAQRVAKAIITLVRHRFAETCADAAAGATISAKGRQNVELTSPAQTIVPGASGRSSLKLKCRAPALLPQAMQIPTTKNALVVSLLKRTSGASIDELTGATGWLPHTTRAALTGLRKQGHVVASERVAGLTTYRIAVAA